MSKEQEPESLETECNVGHLELEDKEHWLCRGEDLDDDNIHKQEDRSLLSHTESSLHQQGVLQKNKVSSTDERDYCQSAPIEEEDENSDSDTDDNVKVIIGNIKISPSMFMEMQRKVNSQTDQDLGKSASVSTMDPTSD